MGPGTSLEVNDMIAALVEASLGSFYLERFMTRSPIQELQELSAHLPGSRGGLGGLAGPDAQGILGSPCFLGAPQDLWPPLSLEGLVFLVHPVGLGLLEFPDHPVREKNELG